jgi:pimeloyl-ACP methyl ester carboxylesterase
MVNSRIASSRVVVVDGIRTHYFDSGGEGPTVVLLHSGEFGACAETTWEFTLPALAERYRVVAPDWLGYGKTDKIHDFGGGTARRIWHMGRFLETLAIEEAAFVGSSMGGTVLARMAADQSCQWPIGAVVLSSGGGFVPFNEARRRLTEYDGSLEGMRAIVATMFHGSEWSSDEEFVARRHRLSLLPGAWEAVAASRLKSPAVERQDDMLGQPDKTPYESIRVPTLIVAGRNDVLRENGYAEDLQRRIPDAQLEVFDNCGHMPQIEQADLFNEKLLSFLKQAWPS